MCSWFFSGGSSGSKQGREHVSQRELSGLWKLNENEWNYSVSICFDDVGVFWILCLDFAISICFGVPAKLASLKDERVSRTTRFQQTWQFPNVSNILRGFAGSCGWHLWASVLQNPADMSEIVRLKAVGQPAGSWKETGFLMFVVRFFFWDQISIELIFLLDVLGFDMFLQDTSRYSSRVDDCDDSWWHWFCSISSFYPIESWAHVQNNDILEKQTCYRFMPPRSSKKTHAETKPVQNGLCKVEFDNFLEIYISPVTGQHHSVHVVDLPDLGLL